MKLSEWAEQEGIHYQTAWKWFRDGKLPVPATKTPSGTILVAVPRASSTRDARAVVYARVSAHDQRSYLDRQVARMTEWATARSMAVSDVVTEVGSGMNGRRRKLSRLLADATAITIIVEHRDRLARFGVEHLEAALSA
jgi:putative resolvase